MSSAFLGSAFATVRGPIRLLWPGARALRGTRRLRHLFLKNLLNYASDKVTNRATAALKLGLQLRML